MAAVDLDAAWQLHPQVAIRPESFGALLYHFGTRRLSFVKDATLVEVIRALDGAATVGQACAAAGVTGSDVARYQRALAGLAASAMVVRRT